MNFKLSEINKWYTTKAGDINSRLITKSISKVFYAGNDKKIIYFGPASIINKIINDNYSFNSFFICSSDGADIKAELQKLPLQDSSIDFVILIHSLDMDENPHAAFREIDRILADDGKIIIAGFNRLSFLGIYSLMPINTIFRNKNYLDISRLSDWMSLFSYEVKQVFNINKIPPLKNKQIIKYLAFFNNNIFSKINYFGNSYVFFASKKTYKFISVKDWHKRDNIILGKFSKSIIQNNYEK